MSEIDIVCRDADVEGLAPLPPVARQLLTKLNAPPRLVAHLHLVHDVAAKLTTRCSSALPNAQFDNEAVAFGAATHDIGKALVPAELVGPGRRHETAGEQWLLAEKIPRILARFARTHGLAPNDASLVIDDLMVIAADKLWKGKRVDQLEERLVCNLAASAHQDKWDVWPHISAVYERLVESADRRLGWHEQYSPEQ